MFLSISPSIIRCVAIAAATPELAQRRSAREGAASGLGGHLRHRPHAGLAGTPRPGAILHMSWVNKVSVARRTARSLAYPPAEAEAGNRRAAFPARPTEEFAAGRHGSGKSPRASGWRCADAFSPLRAVPWSSGPDANSARHGVSCRRWFKAQASSQPAPIASCATPST